MNNAYDFHQIICFYSNFSLYFIFNFTNLYDTITLLNISVDLILEKLQSKE